METAQELIRNINHRQLKRSLRQTVEGIKQFYNSKGFLTEGQLQVLKNVYFYQSQDVQKQLVKDQNLLKKVEQDYKAWQNNPTRAKAEDLEILIQHTLKEMTNRPEKEKVREMRREVRRELIKGC